MSHTPGPWTVTLAWSQQTGDTYSVKPYASEEQMEIDARLIEAAPELLEALTVVLEFLWSNAPSADRWPGTPYAKIMPLAIAAIAKAEGRC